MRSFFIIIIVVIAITITMISVYLTPNDLAYCQRMPSATEPCQKADAIVAVSGGNTKLRTAEAINLYKNGWSDTLIFSGAAADTTGPSNAEVMRQQALDAGIPNESILVEPLSQTTKENAERTKEILVAAGSGSARRVILVTSPYHQRRASLEFRVLAGDGFTIINKPATNDSDWSKLWWLTPRGWWLAIGELVKIGAFYAGESR